LTFLQLSTPGGKALSMRAAADVAEGGAAVTDDNGM
jgi:hypothetical protein